MKFNTSLRILTLALLMAVPLAGCATVQGLFGDRPTTVIVECPQLAPPPEAVLDAIEPVLERDQESAAWVDQLDRHYQKLDACNDR